MWTSIDNWVSTATPDVRLMEESIRAAQAYVSLFKNKRTLPDYFESPVTSLTVNRQRLADMIRSLESKRTRTP